MKTTRVINIMFMAFLAGTLSLTSCSKSGVGDAADGIGYLRIAAQPKADETTKAVNTDNFIIKITEVGTGKLAFKSDYSQIPYIIALRNTNHVVRAVSIDNLLPAAFEAPYYAGEAPVSIEKNVSMELGEIICKLSNVKVTVECTDDLNAEFLDYTVTISNGSGYLEYDKGETRAGYFTVAPLHVAFSGTYRVNDLHIDYAFDINTVAMAQWHKVKLDVTYDNGENGTKSVARGGISVRGTVETTE